jgi:hypothetical protein
MDLSLVMGQHAETITILRDPPRDNFGDPGAGDPPEHTETGVLAPLSSTEDTGEQDTVTSGWTLYSPGPVDILPTDRARIHGDLHQVDGQPRPWNGAGAEVNFVRATG